MTESGDRHDDDVSASAQCDPAPEAIPAIIWVRKTANVLNYMPKSLQPRAKAALNDIWMAPARDEAGRAFVHFITTYEVKYPKAAECLVKDRDKLLTFYDYPAEHWLHLPTTNPIELTFATVRHRTDRAKGCVTRDTMLALTYKLSMSAQTRWHRLRGFNQLAKLITGVKFKAGIDVASSSRYAA